MNKAVNFNVKEQHKIQREVDGLVEDMEQAIERLAEITNYERVDLILRHLHCKNTASRILTRDALPSARWPR